MFEEPTRSIALKTGAPGVSGLLIHVLSGGEMLTPH
jgi:hypothetical protein